MKRILLTTAFAVGALVSSPTHAQFGGITFDPTQSAHAVQQIVQGSQLYTNTVQATRTAISAYNFAHQMMTAPNSYYQQFSSARTFWTALAPSANTYGNSQAWMNSANTGYGAQPAYQRAGIARSMAQLPGYGDLSMPSQQQIAAQGATSDLSDAVNTSSLTNLGTIRANAQQRENDISALEQASRSVNPVDQTEMATLQRINRAMLLQLRTQQETNQMNQDMALQQMIAQKQQQDALKAAFQSAAGYQANYKQNIAPVTNGAANALHY
ncbi:MAG: hypothetical protein ABI209_01810 [Edaphobacter sp.]